MRRVWTDAAAGRAIGDLPPRRRAAVGLRVVQVACPARRVGPRGTVPDYNDGGARSERRRSLLSRLLARREAAAALDPDYPPDEDDFDEAPDPTLNPSPPHGAGSAGRRDRSRRLASANACASRATCARCRPAPSSGQPPQSRCSTPPSTVAPSPAWRGRSGCPGVRARPPTRPRAWSIWSSRGSCAGTATRSTWPKKTPRCVSPRQGYELDELEPNERTANAAADEYGRLVLPA